MSIIRKVRAVERVFGRLDAEIKSFQGTTGLHCLSGCGKCCTKPDIEATPLEFLPLAFQYFSEGIATEKLEELSMGIKSMCDAYRPLSADTPALGHCASYLHRGLICRLFGYGASKNKYGELQLVTCQLIKEKQTENYQLAIKHLAANKEVPVFSDYYKRLIQIDFRLASQFLPVNEAIAEALKEVLHYYSYRPFPKKPKAA